MSVILQKITILGLFIWALNLHVNAEDKAPKIDWLTDTPKAAKLAAEQGKPILVRFGADWCTYCKKMDHYAFDDEAICAKINEHFIPLYIDADLHPGMLAKMQVKSLPSFVVLSPLMNVVDRISGYKKEKEFLEFINPHCKLREIAMQRMQNATPTVEQVQANRFTIKNLAELEQSKLVNTLQPSTAAYTPPTQKMGEFEPFPTSNNSQINTPPTIMTAQAEPFPSTQPFAPPAYDNHLNNYNPMQRTMPEKKENMATVDPKATISNPTRPAPLQLNNPGVTEITEIAMPKQQSNLPDAQLWGENAKNNTLSNRPVASNSLPPASSSGVPKLTEIKSPFEMPVLPETQLEKTNTSIAESQANPFAFPEHPEKVATNPPTEKMPPIAPWETPVVKHENAAEFTHESLTRNSWPDEPKTTDSLSIPASSFPQKTPVTNVSSNNTTIQENTLPTKASITPKPPKPPAFGGVCIVSILEGGKLVNGEEKFNTTYQGFTLNFATQKYLDMFLSNPVRYWPANNGICPVSSIDKQQSLLGEPVFAVRYAGRTHFCADREAALEFLKDPKRYNDFNQK